MTEFDRMVEDFKSDFSSAFEKAATSYRVAPKYRNAVWRAMIHTAQKQTRRGDRPIVDVSFWMHTEMGALLRETRVR